MAEMDGRRRRRRAVAVAGTWRPSPPCLSVRIACAVNAGQQPIKNLGPCPPLERVGKGSAQHRADAAADVDRNW